MSWQNKRILSIPEMNFKRILKSHLLRLLKYQKLYWKKRCTIRWIKFGDENSKFFQAVARERYRQNNISSLKLEDGTLVYNHPAKQALLFQTYKNRLGTVSPSDVKIDLPNIIPRATNLDQLTTPFSHEEIDNVVKGMPPDRAPGPDGFSGAFLKACWPII